MPWYDYRCDACGNEFELQRSVSRRNEADCPRCRSQKVRRLVRSIGLLGGSGARSGGSCGSVRSSGFG